MSPNDAPMWRRGLVRAVDPARAVAKVHLPDEDGLVSDWLPICVPFAMGTRAYWIPKVGSQVVVLLDEHGEDGVIMGAIYSEQDAPPASSADQAVISWADGTAVKYDEAAQELSALVMGTVKIRSMGKATIQSMDGLEFSGAGPVTLQALDTMTVSAQGAMTLNAYGALKVNAYETATVECLTGAVAVRALTISLQATASISVQAPAVSVDAAAINMTGTFTFTGAGTVVGNWIWS